MAQRRNILISVLTRIGLCVLILAVAVITFVVLTRTRPQPARSARAEAAPRILVLPARSVAVQRQWEGFGTARAKNPVNVPARVTSTVEQIPDDVQAGASVDRGDLLVALDPSDFLRQTEIAREVIEEIRQDQANLAIERESWAERRELAEEQVELARADYQRALDAQTQGSALPRDVDAARQVLVNALRDLTITRTEVDRLEPRSAALSARLAAQQAQLRLAEQNVERSTITSPISGVVQSVDVEEGESVPAGSRVARVVDLSVVEVALRLPSSARGDVRVGDEVRLTSTGSGVENWSAEIARIAPEEDEATRTMTVFVEVGQDPQQGGLLAPGRFVRGLVVSSEPEWRWVVPRRSVQEDAILLVEDGRIERYLIDPAYQVEAKFPQLSLPDDLWVVLEDVLPDDALVVLNPTRTLPVGTVVDAVPASDGVISANPPAEATP